MPIHFNDRDVVPEVAGLRSALIVTCNMCPAATIAVREKRPFMNFFRSPLKSAPFQHYLEGLRSKLREKGLSSKVFKSNLYHQWFMCLWTSGQRQKLHEEAKGFDSVIVLWCESATETVRDSIGSNGCKVVEGMEVSGIMNATLKFNFPGSVSFDDCKVVPVKQ
jgi:hypothetical protein